MINKTQAEELLGILTAPVTDFDCGELCAPDNGGEPLCCDHTNIIPLLYAKELKVLRHRTKMWRPLDPNSEEYRDTADDLRPCDRLAVCKGAALCERDNRSLNCRTFPFEPYLDHDRKLVGLVYNYDFDGKCPLVGKEHRIRPDYIEQALTMWGKLFAMAPEEEQFYFEISQSTRRAFGQARRPVPVFTPAGIVEKPTVRRSWRRGA